ncbi:MAG: UDP-N-acetylglucosamine--N-acetylmuramyl-(pentapeptide) pyrophosphoryl-undecaprenol N-acetylglucosamine transferase [Patescibacteria group bacterium]
MKIIFSGGGSLGPVTPLLAVIEAWKKLDPSVQCVWIGTKNGPEKDLIENENIVFQSIAVAKFARYFSLEWILLPFKLLFAFSQALRIISKEKPDLVASAGGFTSVPVVISAWLLGIPSWIHQSDVLPILTNKILAPFASCITVAWKLTLPSFPISKTKWIGNPVRESMLGVSKEQGEKFFNLDSQKPTVFVVGGGGGALWINNQMEKIGKKLSERANVIHVTGTGKTKDNFSEFGKNYVVKEMLGKDISSAFACADIVVTRAGMGGLTEVCAFKKPAIVIPMPNSPQERNAQILNDTDSAIVFNQIGATADDLYNEIISLLDDKKKQQELSQHLATILPTNTALQFVEHVRLCCLQK